MYPDQALVFDDSLRAEAFPFPLPPPERRTNPEWFALSRRSSGGVSPCRSWKIGIGGGVSHSSWSRVFEGRATMETSTNILDPVRLPLTSLHTWPFAPNFHLHCWNHPTNYLGFSTGVGLGTVHTYTKECTVFPETSMLVQFLNLYSANRT